MKSPIIESELRVGVVNDTVVYAVAVFARTACSHESVVCGGVVVVIAAYAAVPGDMSKSPPKSIVMSGYVAVAQLAEIQSARLRTAQRLMIESDAS